MSFKVGDIVVKNKSLPTEYYEVIAAVPNGCYDCHPLNPTTLERRTWEKVETILGMDLVYMSMRGQQSSAEIKKEKPYCDHKWTFYHGLRDVYEFCTKCDEKRKY